MKTCKVKDCPRTDIKGLGMCGMHYQRFKKYGHTDRTQTPKGFALEHPLEYKRYTSMKNRCYNKNNPAYKNYGGRGIKVCDRWLGADGFKHFLEDMVPRPSKEHSLDRTDNNKDYSPENCRWATVEEQGNNRRSTKMITFNGETLSEAQWAKKIGVNKGTLHGRLKRGIPVEQALTMRTQEKKGELYQLAQQYGVDKLRTYKRLKRGWSLEDALLLPPQTTKYRRQK